jgi:hypothetical protein
MSRRILLHPRRYSTSILSSKRLAVWALDTQATLPRLENLEFIRIRGGNNANVAAQAGLFILLKQKYARGSAFEGPAAGAPEAESR